MSALILFNWRTSHLILYDSVGLTGIPAALSAIREDLGLLHPEWDSLGESWHEFARKWLAAEITLAKAGRNMMGIDELQSSDVPTALKAWGEAQITKAEFDANILTEQFGDEMRKWWDGLGIKQDREVDRLLAFTWCRNGKVGIAMLVLGMRWWADKSGAGKEWTRVLGEIATMWELIAAAPSL